MKEFITLGQDVIVSDPCYDVPTWCQIKLKDVKPGKYRYFIREHDAGDWGTRTSMLMVIHEDHVNDKLRWSEHSGTVGVDSGQAGIFSMDTYRVDNLDIKTPETIYDGTVFNLPYREPGDDFYLKMCRLTLSDEGHGVYDNGVVTRSGLGDGSYTLFTSKKKGEFVALCVDFNVEEGQYVFDWYKEMI